MKLKFDWFWGCVGFCGILGYILEEPLYLSRNSQKNMRKGLNNTIRNNLKSDEMMRIECPFRRNTRDASLRENEFIRPDLVWEEASRVRDAIGQYPMK